MTFHRFHLPLGISAPASHRWQAVWLAVLCAALPPCLAGAVQTPAYQQWEAWVVACDNTARCQAIAANTLDSPFQLRLVHRAGPTGVLALMLESRVPLDLDALRLDGKPLKLSPAHWHVSPFIDDQQRLESRDAASVRQLLAQLRTSTTLTASADLHQPGVPLAGLDAALSMMDQVQGRTGTVTALLHPGNLPASRVPAAPPLPHVPVAAASMPPLDEMQHQDLLDTVRTSQQVALRQNDCFSISLDNPRDTNYLDFAVALNVRQALVMLECSREPSRYLAFRAALDQPTQAQRLRLPLPMTQGELGQRYWDMFYTPGYSHDRAELYDWNTFRGNADCGESAGWRFDGEDFHLLYWDYLGSCRYDLPSHWPALWRSAWPAEQDTLIP